MGGLVSLEVLPYSFGSERILCLLCTSSGHVCPVLRCKPCKTGQVIDFNGCPTCCCRDPKCEVRYMHTGSLPFYVCYMCEILVLAIPNTTTIITPITTLMAVIALNKLHVFHDLIIQYSKQFLSYFSTAGLVQKKIQLCRRKMYVFRPTVHNITNEACIFCTLLNDVEALNSIPISSITYCIYLCI